MTTDGNAPAMDDQSTEIHRERKNKSIGPPGDFGARHPRTLYAEARAQDAIYLKRELKRALV